jgi:3-hydroxyisobutyrate dehydrogenase-like beta-hydroxyacid dehydrogenase
VRIAWIGLGKMGLPIARRLRDAGNEVVVFARNTAGRARAEAVGFEAQETMVAAVRGAEVVFSAVSDDTALLDVVAGDGGLAAALHEGQTFIETSTVSPSASRRVAEILEGRKVCYLRSPVSGSTATAEAGQLTAIISGPRGAFDSFEPVLGAFAAKRFHVGLGEEARVLKLAVNAMVAATAALLAETLAFAGRGGVPLNVALEVVAQSAVASPLIGYKKDMISAGDYTPAFTVMQIMKDLDLLLQSGRDAHAPLPLASLVRQQYETSYLHGNGEKDYFVLVKEAAELVDIPNAADQ